jgi:hypothetical protein
MSGHGVWDTKSAISSFFHISALNIDLIFSESLRMAPYFIKNTFLLIFTDHSENKYAISTQK